jgi:hypothetical protein
MPVSERPARRPTSTTTIESVIGIPRRVSRTWITEEFAGSS